MENYGGIVFNGDNYSKEWLVESKKRGLPNITSTVEAICEFKKDYSIELFEKYNILSRDEIEARVNISLEQYVNQINIEARTAIDMLNQQYIPALYKSKKIYSNGIIEGSVDSLHNSVSGLEIKIGEASN